MFLLLVRLTVSGTVQGVGFRPFIYRLARSLGLNGDVKNLGDAGVEIYLDGSQRQIDEFLVRLRENSPPLSEIEEVKVDYPEKKPVYNDFKILPSSKDTTNRISVIPPDISICDECVKELLDKGNRRKNYFFITCTNCGPRFTIIDSLPYDRLRTPMSDFPMCDNCYREYNNPLDRRFHAQTIACSDCGPEIYITDNSGRRVEALDPVMEAVRLIEEGNIIALKGNGGFHFVTSTIKSEPIIRLRERKNRPTKPFAIMSPNIENIKKFALVSEAEKRLLESYIRPIVLLNKRDDYFLSEEIAPTLHNIGVMLPYSGLHYLIFSKCKEPALVMTSANPQDEPVAIENEAAIERLGKYVDYFMLNDRRISQRCDDSVVRFHGGEALLIRRSRGYVPKPIELPWLKESSPPILGCGGEENVTFCILKDRKAFLSQYIGKTQNYETYNFYKEAIRHFKKILNTDFKAAACDLHEGFNTTRYAHRLALESGIPVVKIQHHYAHLAGLMAEHRLEPMTGIIVDGFGLGEDGSAWGGEIVAYEKSKFARLGHIEEFPIPGGDLATRFPLRIAMGFLRGEKNYDGWINENRDKFPYGLTEIRVVDNILSSGKSLKSTSAGRFLDCIAAILGICYSRTYDGEPAIRLESAGVNGRKILNTEPLIKGNILIISEFIKEIYKEKDKHRIRDLAYTAMSYLANGISELAIKISRQKKLSTIGISGGVSYNQVISSIVKSNIEAEGFRFVSHKSVPAGDGGLSFGQAVGYQLLENLEATG